MPSAGTRSEVEPLQELLERDRRRGDAVVQRLSATLSSLTIARAPFRVGELIDPAAPETWIGSGEATRDFSDVLPSLLDAPRSLPDPRRAPAMETLDLRRPPPDFRLAAEGEGGPAPSGIATPGRTRSHGEEVAAKDAAARGEELLEEVSGRVYELLMDDLEQAFESR